MEDTFNGYIDTVNLSRIFIAFWKEQTIDRLNRKKWDVVDT